jgi:hypothetical protein
VRSVPQVKRFAAVAKQVARSALRTARRSPQLAVGTWRRLSRLALFIFQLYRAFLHWLHHHHPLFPFLAGSVLYTILMLLAVLIKSWLVEELFRSFSVPPLRSSAMPVLSSSPSLPELLAFGKLMLLHSVDVFGNLVIFVIYFLVVVSKAIRLLRHYW